MRHRSNSKRNVSDTILLGGWLFADLLLGLMIIFLVSAQGVPQVTATVPTPTPPATIAPTPTPIPPATLEKVPLDRSIGTNVDALLGPDGNAKKQEQDRLRGLIRQTFNDFRNRRAGFVLTFGTSPDPNEGTQLADAVDQLLPEAMPATFNSAVFNGYHNIDDISKRGIVEIQIFLFAQ